MLFGKLRSHTGFSAFSVAILLPLTACAKQQGAPQVVAPMPVTVATVERRDVALDGDWVATLDGFVKAQIQPKGSGYMIKQDYREGSVVQSGEVLFEIDPRPFQATLDQAEGQLAQARAQLANAEAVQGRTRLDVERYTPLAKEQAASQQDLD